MRVKHYIEMATPLLFSLSASRSFLLPRAASTANISTSSLMMRSRKINRGDDSWFDNSDPYIGKGRNMAPNYNPRTPAQSTYVKALENPDLPIVFGIGPAGCGKTLFACLTAVKELRSGKIKKIVLTRPIVPVEEEEIGFLPGSLVKKMDPWTRPIFDILLEFYPQRDLDHMVQNGVIEISPLAFMRGRTFKHAFIIADEMQNSTPNQMMMLTTRIGDCTKMIITGDLKQTDRGELGNGLSDLIQKVEAYQSDLLPMHAESNSVFPIRYKKDIEIVRMSATDVQRNPIVTRILDIYQYKPLSGEKKNKNLSVNKKNTKVNVSNTNNDSALIPKSRLPNSER
jgi:phosphate starvation-inducible PhoH-like protein